MSKNIYQNRFEHLLDLIARHGGQTAVADKLGVTKQYIHLISKADPKNIGNKMARKIEETFGLPINSIDNEMGGKEPQQESASIDIPLLNLVLAISRAPEFDDMVQQLRLSKRWIRQHTEATSFEQLARIELRGDHMAPTLANGSTLLIDTAIRRIEGAAVYVLIREAEIFVRRVQKNIDGSYALSSDNPAYQPEVISDPLKAGIVVCGRVVAALNPRKT